MFPILVCSAYLFLMWVVCVLLPSPNLCLIIMGQDHNLPIEAIISKTHIGLPSSLVHIWSSVSPVSILSIWDYFFCSFSSAKGI